MVLVSQEKFLDEESEIVDAVFSIHNKDNARSLISIFAEEGYEITIWTDCEGVYMMKLKGEEIDEN